jgi:hypothetical protein
MAGSVPFEHVLSLMEEHGWSLKQTWPPYRMFSKPGHLPILVPVENRMVTIDDFQTARQAVQ